MKTVDIELIGRGFSWEQLPVGKQYRTVSRTITEADLVNFIGNTGMLEVLFTNSCEERGDGEIKGRLVPAALVYAFAEGLLIPAVQMMGIAFLKMDLEVKGPVFVGDTIYVKCEVIECRESASRPGLGLVKTRNSIIKQDDAICIVYTPLRLLKGK